ncbi:hypothetical protein JMJ77_0008038 [Colletotrichum scovillei]|uniref:Uncharacterized protein n=1 Tax=Colletotrichum scovillei TaxID=1209932 RepID=A0A9P7UG34_9PEZI|nr:hypothetical protein JMJ77_0008038 [Colletotrichum scovillei]KAG7075027.1 hypothetical protein JMJ76_0011491 [Colletotrichum scovillei]KAG7082418.1 hypothetical protein JMJ78_0004520 [Colletotrichum scovillei]
MVSLILYRLSLFASSNRLSTQQVIFCRRSADSSTELHRKSTRRDRSPRSRSKTPTRQSGTKLMLPAAWQKSRSATGASETGLNEQWSLEEIKPVTERHFLRSASNYVIFNVPPKCVRNQALPARGLANLGRRSISIVDGTKYYYSTD